MKGKKVKGERSCLKSPVMADLIRHPLKLIVDYQGIAGLRYATPAMTKHFRDSFFHPLPFTLLFGITVWTFFAIFYRHHLHYQEEIQLFLTTRSYWLESIRLPGGFAGYLNRFFIQFFVDSFAGALCIAGLLVLLQQLVWHVSFARKTNAYLLTFIPSILYAFVLMDENFLLTALIALILSLSAVVLYNRLFPRKVRFVYLLLMIPALYWLAGGASLVFILICLSKEGLQKGKADKIRAVVLCLLAFAIYALAVMTAKNTVAAQYPMTWLWLASDYYRYIAIFPVILLLIFLLIVILPVLLYYLPETTHRKKRLLINLIEGVLLILFMVWGVKTYADRTKEEILAYDYFARSQKWNAIIRLADKKSPDGPLSVATLNLALAKQGYMPDNLFDYYQNGVQGLLPAFQKEFIMDVMVGEIYYHLGLVNTAQRFAFEGMESIPNQQKSVRCIRRLAETNLINGQYQAANKYLSLLKHTLFYKKWANETAAYLYNEEKINAHPEWGKLRQFRPKQDFLFSEREKDQMLGLLYQRNPDNRMAYEYLLAYTLLNKDLQSFLKYYFLEKHAGDRSKSYQEALAFIRRQTKLNPELHPVEISTETESALKSFFEAYQKTPTQKALYDKYGKTYWYYLVF